MKTLFVLLDKEIRQFFRNAFLPKLVIVFPVMVILIIPWVTTMDVRHIGVSVVDNDHSETSRRIIQKIEASDYFNFEMALPKVMTTRSLCWKGVRPM